MTAVKNPTQWLPPSGSGYIVTVGTEFITTNAGVFLTDNLGDFLVTTPTYDVEKFATQWTGTGA